MREYTLSLRVSFRENEAQKVKALNTLIKRAAQELLSGTMLLSDTGLEPEITLRSNDFFLAGSEELNLLDEHQE